MFSLFKKMFGSKPAKAAAVKPTVRAVRAVNGTPTPAGVAQPKPQVAVAQLSLAAIVNKFPADLQKYVLAMPPETATVALPLSTIHKQLAAGAVKMSLASLFRQAPAGTFREWKSEEKRMVEVPLGEVMRHVNVQGLKRRTDQRKVDLPKGAPKLFGDRKNPYAVAPVFDEDEEEETPEPVAEPEAEVEAELEEPTFRMTPRVVSMPKVAAPTEAAEAEPAPALNGSISMRLGDLCEGWPEPIRSEALAMSEAQVALPTTTVAAGLSKGKVALTWGEIRSRLSPEPAEASEAEEGTELSLPLKAVAPIFMAHSRPKARKRATVELDETIPALFGGATAEPAPVMETAPEPAVASSAEESTAMAFPEAPAFKLAPSVAAHVPEAAPVPAPEAISAQTLGELFGKPEQTAWAAKEIIERTAQLPGVAGAVLALQEGLLVAASLPEEMKGDTIAAFLPQIFARLNIYTGEMKLSDVEDILMTTNGAHFQAYRLGQVYFAVLGQTGSTLPWEALRLVVRELASQAPA